MASSSADPFVDRVNDGLVRPRPRKPVHSQLSQISNLSDSSNGMLEVPESGLSTGLTR